MIIGGTSYVLMLLRMIFFSIGRYGKRGRGLNIEIYIERYNIEIKYIVSYFHKFCLFLRLSPE